MYYCNTNLKLKTMIRNLKYRYYGCVYCGCSIFYFSDVKRCLGCDQPFEVKHI